MYTDEQIAAIRAAHGDRLMILSAGDEQIAVRKLDRAEFDAVQEISREDPDWQELALLRAVVAVPGPLGEASGGAAQALQGELIRVNALLDQDPQLGDVWGAQLMAAAGQGARIARSDGQARAVTLTVQIGAERVVLQAARPGRAQWKDVRRAIVKGGTEAGARRCWDLCVQAPGDTAERYPALPLTVGAYVMGLMTREASDPK